MSTKDILSEGELDALMESVSDDDVSAGSTSSGKSYQLFDFGSREQALLAQMPALKTIIEKQSLALSEYVQQLFRMPIVMETGEIQLVKLDEAIGNIAKPSAINLIKTLPLNGISFIVMSGEILSTIVDQYFGGQSNGASQKSSREDLTPTEKRINDVLIEKFLLTITEAWREKIVLTPEQVSFETNTDFMQADSPDDLALQFSFGVTLGDTQSSIDWVVPYAALEPLRAKLGSLASSLKVEQSKTDWENYFRQELLNVELNVSGLFASRSVTLAEVLKLKPGSVVPLKAPSDVIACIEGQPFSSCAHGALNGNKSIKIKEIFNNESGAP